MRLRFHFSSTFAYGRPRVGRTPEEQRFYEERHEEQRRECDRRCRAADSPSRAEERARGAPSKRLGRAADPTVREEERARAAARRRRGHSGTRQRLDNHHLPTVTKSCAPRRAEPHYTVSLAALNVRSLRLHAPDVIHDALRRWLSLFCPSETWSDFFVQVGGYTGVECDRRVDSCAGGIAIYVRNDLASTIPP
ncbi:hypothetical protein HPB49_015754 [Dermacentor silvarum]|uniref:Uncharacterized protein n=1 Tax=Dermacentor silvarum TaxID=543639 RepID=A0ACB8CLT3_DERSI|nr:hypothetical protein HPB49_015754 [Dermacentor silvarum]